MPRAKRMAAWSKSFLVGGIIATVTGGTIVIASAMPAAFGYHPRAGISPIHLIDILAVLGTAVLGIGFLTAFVGGVLLLFIPQSQNTPPGRDVETNP